MYQNKISNSIILFSQTITCLCKIPPRRTNTVFETASIETTTPKENDNFVTWRSILIHNTIYIDWANKK